MTTDRTLVRLAAVVAVAVLGAACGGDDDAGSTDAESVQGTEWVLSEMTGSAVADGVEVTLTYDGTAIAGSGGCNNYNGEASFDDGSVSISPAMAMTMMACEGPAAEVESEFVTVLPTATTFVVIDDELRLGNDAGEEILVFVPAG